MRLLLAEDNDELPDLLVKALKAAGYDADVVTTISKARAVLLAAYYVALVLDLGLPDGDALSMVRDIRARNISLPILILTARGGIGPVRQPLGDGHPPRTGLVSPIRAGTIMQGGAFAEALNRTAIAYLLKEAAAARMQWAAPEDGLCQLAS